MRGQIVLVDFHVMVRIEIEEFTIYNVEMLIAKVE